MLPSGPAVMPGKTFPVLEHPHGPALGAPAPDPGAGALVDVVDVVVPGGRGNNVTVPSGVIRPTPSPGKDVTNQRFPSGPVASPPGVPAAGSACSVTANLGEGCGPGVGVGSGRVLDTVS